MSVLLTNGQGRERAEKPEFCVMDILVDFIRVLASIIGFLVLVYFAARLGSAAFFRSWHEFERRRHESEINHDEENE